MAIQNINVGFSANDGTGDDLREAFIKVNQNFQQLDAIALQTGNNLGSTGATVFASQVENILNFRRLLAGTNITLTELDNTIVIDGTVPDQSTIITTDSGSINIGNGQPWDLYGGRGVEVVADNSASPNPQIIINSAVEDDTSPQLSAGLDANSQNITGVNNFSAASILVSELNVTDDTTVGNLFPTTIKTTGTSTTNYEQALGRFLTWDMGPVDVNYTGQLQWLIGNTPVDLGSLGTPASGTIDLGSLV